MRGCSVVVGRLILTFVLGMANATLPLGALSAGASTVGSTACAIVRGEGLAFASAGCGLIAGGCGLLEDEAPAAGGLVAVPPAAIHAAERSSAALRPAPRGPGCPMDCFLILSTSAAALAILASLSARSFVPWSDRYWRSDPLGCRFSTSFPYHQVEASHLGCLSGRCDSSFRVPRGVRGGEPGGGSVELEGGCPEGASG